MKAAFEGCYEGSRAAALSGVPVSTVYLWARTGIVEPLGVAHEDQVVVLRRSHGVADRLLAPPSQEGSGSNIAASPMASVRKALAELEHRGLDIWDDSGARPDSPLRVDSSANIVVVGGEDVSRVDGQQLLAGTLDLLGPFESDGRRGA